ncbi:uncharacterized protein N7482_010216 [Penicillium canariense]|uniref:Ornithine decarboxylase antizyme n=1 Tax=Penicillium canariense TaxID=189055 RepID=A0A9W9HL39_9EURO|nr:uncharacterized protein N7482_010216 [Penicillium canariense]KAJ5150964.1 hypothetical protein N7482_010216 [Penicillium canariense]
MTRFPTQEPTVMASCYAVESGSTVVHGFHYCTTLGAGSKRSTSRPPLEYSAPGGSLSWAGNNWPESKAKGEATHTIPEECERLFCDRLSTTFLGERIGARQESLGMGTFQRTQPSQHPRQHPHQTGQGHERPRIQRWIEVWDYSGDAIYRGFVAGEGDERTLFVFLEDGALGHGLKSGLIALFELAGIDAFDCSQIVACVKRSQHPDEMELVRSLGWCGFNLTTLEPWSRGVPGSSGPCFSTKWLFLVAEV